MSGRVRKQSDCPIGKQGPMRATLPVSSLMKQTGGVRKSCGNSPDTSPTNNWPTVAPDDALSGRRSPGAINYGESVQNENSAIRRTASLDGINQQGQWPIDCFYLHAGSLQVDKATQTDDGTFKWVSSPPTVSSSEGLDRVIRHHRVVSRPGPSRGTAPHLEHASQTMSPVFFSAIKPGSNVPLRATRSSVEGLNQEIEKLVLCPTPHHQIDRLTDKVTPEGHRAPLAELLRRSVNTQTPALPDSQSQSAHSSGPPSRESLSSGCSPEPHRKPGGSVCSSPDLDSNRLGTSPHINKFLAREPPDGCERVSLKFTEKKSAAGQGVSELCPIRPNVNFQLRPSLGSAFQPLQPPQPQPPTESPPHSPPSSSPEETSPTNS